MRYRVNLFPQELKPKLELFTLNFVLLTWLLAGVVLFSMNQHFLFKYDDIQNRTQTIQRDYNNKTKLLRDLTQTRDNREQDPQLLANVQRLQNEVRDKQLLLTELKGREQLKNQGFSTLMKDLATNHVQEIWLTRISINERKIRMEGGSVESSKVPVWVNKLKDTEYFSGRNFAGARMFRDDDDELSFVISSDLSELALEAAVNNQLVTPR